MSVLSRLELKTGENEVRIRVVKLGFIDRGKAERRKAFPIRET